MKSSFCCCFLGARDDAPSSSSPSSLIRSSSSWIRSKTPHQLPDVKDRYLSLVNRIGKHRRHGSGGFQYDSLSYALNFDDGPGDDDDDALEGSRFRNFSSRLPPTPPQPVVSAVGVA